MSGIQSVFIGPEPRIHVRVAGQGPLILFLHGVGGNSKNWESQLRFFSDRFTVAAWDARGYGLSDESDPSLEMNDFTDDLSRILDHFGVAKAHIVGLSMGALTALNYYFRHPGRVNSLTLCNTSAGLDHDPVRAAEFLRTRLEPLDAGKTMADISKGVAAALVSPEAAPDIRQELVDSMTAIKKNCYINALHVVVGASIGGDLEKIQVPTLFVTGGDDKLTPASVAERAAALIPDCRLVNIQGAGHLTNLEKPEVFNQALEGFLAENGSVAV